MSQDIIDNFNSLYLNSLETWPKTYWLGQHVAKCPTDLWVYQEIMSETRPEVILECGTYIGGSAFFFATMFDLLGIDGRVITADVFNYAGQRPKHPKITYLLGDSISKPIVKQMADAARGKRTMVTMDSSHTYEQTAGELETYTELVTPGCYAVLEDTHVPGTRQALTEFISEPDCRFEVDKSRESQMLTFNIDGWLKRIR